MSGDLLVGTDVGTLGTKSVICDVEGNVLASAFVEYPINVPKPGWAEFPIERPARAAFETIKAVLKKSGRDPADVAGLCVSGLYGGSGVPVDSRMEEIRPALPWLDVRAVPQCRWVEEHVGADRVGEVTGNCVHPYWGFTKMLWIKQNEPDNWERIHQLLTPNGYVVWMLTGEVSLDYSSAGNYGGVFDIRRYGFAEDLMEELGIPRSFFPEGLVKSADVVGEVSAEGSKLCGLKPGTPVSAGGIDAPVEALSVGTFERGEHTATLGTSMCWNVVQPREDAKISPALINYPYVADDERKIYTFGGAATAGGAVAWFRDVAGAAEVAAAEASDGSAYQLLDEGAAKVPAGASGLLVLPYFSGERTPVWDPHARAIVFGLSLFHTRAHLFRAFLEGVAFTLRDNVEAARTTGVQLGPTMYLVGGGARSALWRKIIADVTGFNVAHVTKAFGAPLGDVVLAGVGNGLFDYSAVKEWLGEPDVTAPDPSASAAYDAAFRRWKALYTSNKALFAQLAGDE
ncbi:MAG: FGGY-family carbohydrate kinase [Promethearchaeota archaeon]